MRNSFGAWWNQKKKKRKKKMETKQDLSSSQEPESDDVVVGRTETLKICSLCLFANPVNCVTCEMCHSELRLKSNDGHGPKRSSTAATACSTSSFRKLEDEEEQQKQSVLDQRKSHIKVPPSLNKIVVEGLAESREHDEASTIPLNWQMTGDDVRKSMMSSATGKAWYLVHAVLSLTTRLNSEFESFQEEVAPISTEDMYTAAEDLINLQEEFRCRHKPTTATIAYHNTKREYLQTIRHHGLLTGPDREPLDIIAHKATEARYGHGVYVSNSPFGFLDVGNVCVIVAVIMGTTACTRQYRRMSHTYEDADTVITNEDGYQGSKPDFKDQIVLKRSAQCLPLIRFTSSMIEGVEHDLVATKLSQLIWKYHQLLQYMIDEMLNDGEETEPEMELRYSDVVLPRIPRHVLETFMVAPAQKPVKDSRS